MNLAAGARLGPYEIVSLIGAGGMGEVYRAKDVRLGRDVALKILPPTFASDHSRLQRFEQEARATAALNDANIVAVYDAGTFDGQPYVVSELLEEAGLDRAKARQLKRQVLEGMILLCRWQLERMEEGSPGPAPRRRARKVSID